MDLSTQYLGLKLKSPLVVSAAQPLSENIDDIKRMEDAGAAAVVLYSLFEEQIRREQIEMHEQVSSHTESFPEAQSFFPEPSEFQLGPEGYLNHIRKAKEAVKMPVIASLNGMSVGGWTDFAKKMEQAGADALELNIYSLPTDMNLTAEKLESAYVDILKAVKSNVKIPVAVKLSPFFTNMANMAKKLDQAGADGLVLFNRFYQPDIDLEQLEVRPDLVLSGPWSLRLPLRWIAILYGRLRADLAATRGIQRPEDVIKMVMAGAKVTMLCATLLKYGIDYLGTIEKGLVKWMEEHEYQSIAQMLGSMSQKNCADPAAFERAQYIRILHSYQPR
jgi:dihydroorotate dehydrogenase (fumarate)